MSAPISASAIAIAWPIPLVPPVTRAVWPWRENKSWTEGMIGQFLGLYQVVGWWYILEVKMLISMTCDVDVRLSNADTDRFDLTSHNGRRCLTNVWMTRTAHRFTGTRLVYD